MTDMDLKDFVEQTLTQIMEGIKAAQAKTDHGGLISPAVLHYGSVSNGIQSDAGEYPEMVDFDVAVTAERGTGSKGGIGLVVGPVTLGSTGQSNEQNSSVSRIKFRVPVVLPAARRSKK
jgi:hypothetical protein